jgi:hypothetical protein
MSWSEVQRIRREKREEVRRWGAGHAGRMGSPSPLFGSRSEGGPIQAARVENPPIGETIAVGASDVELAAATPTVVTFDREVGERQGFVFAAPSDEIMPTGSLYYDVSVEVDRGAFGGTVAVEVLRGSTVVWGPDESPYWADPKVPVTAHGRLPVDGQPWRVRLTASAAVTLPTVVVQCKAVEAAKFIAADPEPEGGFFAVGSSGAAVTSEDGTTFVDASLGSPWPTFWTVAHHDGLWVVAGLNSTLYTYDGTWTQRTSPVSASLRGAAYGNGLWVVVGFGPSIITSPDGTTWTARTPAGTSNLEDVWFHDGLFVAVGSGGTIETSPDGINWTARTSGVSENLYAVVYGDDCWVAAGAVDSNFDARILRSTDGTSWTAQTSPVPNTIQAAAHGAGTFVVVTSSGDIASSTDGQTWTVQTSPAAGQLWGVAYSAGQFVAVGFDSGVVYAKAYTSEDGVTWLERDIPEAWEVYGLYAVASS